MNCGLKLFDGGSLGGLHNLGKRPIESVNKLDENEIKLLDIKVSCTNEIIPFKFLFNYDTLCFIAHLYFF